MPLAVRRPAFPARPASGAAALRGLPTPTILGIGALVTTIAFAESWRGWPYAPFPLLHAGLAISIPLWLRLGPTGRPWEEIRTHLPRQGLPIAVAVAFVAAFIGLYAALLTITGRGHDPAWNLIATYRHFWDLFVARYDRPTVVLVSYLFLGLWPMLGEELFYRGFLMRGLTDRGPVLAAAIATSVLFGLRHAFQLTYLLPSYPVVAGVAYFVWAFGVSMIWCWVHARTESLWLCIGTHGMNVVLAPVVLVILSH